MGVRGPMKSRRRQSVRETIGNGVDRFGASDPGLNRLLTATRALVAVGTTLALEFLFARSIGAGSRGELIAMLLGTIVAMISSMALSTGTTKERAITAVVFPISIGTGMAAGAIAAKNPELLLAFFVIVLFAAVYIRRFGMRFFFAGFMMWIGYFIASFLRVPVEKVPGLVLFAAIATAWVLLLSVTVLRESPRRTLRHTLRAFEAHAEAVSGAAASVISDPTPPALKRLARRQRLLDETALMIEGQLGEHTAVPSGWSATVLRRELLDAQLAIDQIVTEAPVLAKEVSETGLAADAREGLSELAVGRLEAATNHATSIDRRISGGRPDSQEMRASAARLSAALTSYCGWITAWRARGAGASNDTNTGEFTSSVTLFMGRLSGSTPIAREVPARSASWNPLARLPLTTRQAIQVALAGGLAILVGRELSPERYYWAVIAAFIAFTGTATRAETFFKGMNRVIGTAAGLGAAIALAHLTEGSTPATIAVILASIFLAFYLRPINYAFMIFFITIMLAQLYSILHELSDKLLFLRLEETAIGAAIGVVIGLFVMPVSTRDTSRLARQNFFHNLREMLRATAAHLDDAPTSDGATSEYRDSNLDALARAVDGDLRQLRLILRPLTTPLARRADAGRINQRLALFTRAATIARGLASEVRRAQDLEPSLAASCRALAEAADRLADRRDVGDSLETADRSLQDALCSLDAIRAGGPGEPPESAANVHDVLLRLLHVFHRLAETTPVT